MVVLPLTIISADNPPTSLEEEKHIGDFHYSQIHESAMYHYSYNVTWSPPVYPQKYNCNSIKNYKIEYGDANKFHNFFSNQWVPTSSNETVRLHLII